MVTSPAFSRVSPRTEQSMRAQPLGWSETMRVVAHPLKRSENRFGSQSEPVIWGYLKPIQSEVTIGRSRQPKRRYAIGDLRLVRPGNEILRVPDKPTVIRSLHLPKQAFEEHLGGSDPEIDAALGKLESETFRSCLIDSLIDSLARVQDTQTPRFFIQSLANSVLFELWRIAGSEAQEPQSRHCLDQATLDKIDRYIEAEASEKIDLHSLASIAGLPVSVFSRAFREATGTTPYQHVIALRTEKARRLVCATQLSLAEIAYECGFCSQSHMTDVFKAKLGASPARIRRDVA